MPTELTRIAARPCADARPQAADLSLRCGPAPCIESDGVPTIAGERAFCWLSPDECRRAGCEGYFLRRAGRTSA